LKLLFLKKKVLVNNDSDIFLINLFLFVLAWIRGFFSLKIGNKAPIKV